MEGAVMTDPTKVMHLPEGANPPRKELPPKYPFLRIIIALVIFDAFLWIVAIMYWLINWEDIRAGIG